jgi:mono/diheme cytochrome c family protein
LLLSAALSVSATTTAIAAEAASVARGAYLAAAAGCDTCHTDSKNGGEPYAGGRVMQTPFGAIATPNITPDRTTGIGDWSAKDFASAMRWGIARDGSHYVPAFPFAYFGRMTDDDLTDLKAFLDSLRPVERPVPGTAALALFARARAAIGAVVAAGSSQPPVGHCSDCHTPLTWLGAPDTDRYLAGVRGGLWGGGPNVTPDAKTGIGTWSVDDIAQALKTGDAPTFEVLGGAMAEIVRNTSRLTDEDRHAIAAYLKTLPPKVFTKNN